MGQQDTPPSTSKHYDVKQRKHRKDRGICEGATSAWTNGAGAAGGRAVEGHGGAPHPGDHHYLEQPPLRLGFLRRTAKRPRPSCEIPVRGLRSGLGLRLSILRLFL